MKEINIVCRPKDYEEWCMVKTTCNKYQHIKVYYDTPGSDDTFSTYEEYPLISNEVRIITELNYNVQGSSRVAGRKEVSVKTFLNIISNNILKPIPQCKVHSFF